MIRYRLLALAGACLAIAGCATPYCGRDQPYQRAESIPPIVGTGDLKVQSTPTALRIPEPKGGEGLGFGYLVPDPLKAGKTKLVCLDVPPPIPPASDATK